MFVELDWCIDEKATPRSINSPEFNDKERFARLLRSNDTFRSFMVETLRDWKLGLQFSNNDAGWQLSLLPAPDFESQISPEIIVKAALSRTWFQTFAKPELFRVAIRKCDAVNRYMY